MIALLQAPLRHKSVVLSFGYRQEIEFIRDTHIGLLDWLQAQQSYPRFYWCSRDGELEIAAAGATERFTSLMSAQAFIQRFRETDCQPILVGGVPFPGTHEVSSEAGPGPADRLASLTDPEETFFFLPEQALIRRGVNIFRVRFLAHQGPNKVSKSSSGGTLTGIAGLTGGEFMSPEQRAQRSDLPALHCRRDLPELPHWSELVDKVLHPESLISCPKVVLARQSRFALPRPVSAFALLKRWHQAEHRTIPFLMQLAPDSSFLGCTPERLYQRRSREITTEALAGTVRNCPLGGGAGVSELRSDIKIHRENFLVQDYIERQLMSLCETTQVNPFADVVELKHIQHLRKSMTGYLHPEIQDEGILNALHPTPAIGGAPKDLALRFIAEHEPFQRGWYAGAIGYMSADETEFSVAIRSALIQSETIDFYAGAGIVAGSEPIAEWLELESKIASVLALFDPDDSVPCL